MFRPFGAQEMREILDKELARCWRGAACAGGRGRSSSTSRRYEFLLDKGFTPELGARPLKRAVERTC